MECGEHGDGDPWAGGLISKGRAAELERLQQAFDRLAKGDFAFSVTVALPGPSARRHAAIDRIGRQFAAECQEKAIAVLSGETPDG